LVLEEMQKVHPLKSEFVFYDPRHPEKPKNIQETWKKVRQRAGLWQDQDDPLDRVVLHSTRHTATTQLIRTESNLAKVQNVTGHKTLSQLNRYTHLNTDESVALAEKAFGNGSGTA
jgi:integrase